MATFQMLSESGKRWAVGPTTSDGRDLTRAEARQVAGDLGFLLLDANSDGGVYRCPERGAHKMHRWGLDSGQAWPCDGVGRDD